MVLAGIPLTFAPFWWPRGAGWTDSVPSQSRVGLLRASAVDYGPLDHCHPDQHAVIALIYRNAYPAPNPGTACCPVPSWRPPCGLRPHCCLAGICGATRIQRHVWLAGSGHRPAGVNVHDFSDFSWAPNSTPCLPAKPTGAGTDRNPHHREIDRLAQSGVLA